MKKILAEILSIGDEILYGQILDTNSQWISAEMDKIGVKIIRKTTIGDQEDEMMQAFEEAESRADIVLITGGLGPTNDDLTKPLLARYFDSPMSMHPQALKEVEELFKSRGREMTELNRKQAELPDKCQMVSNKLGTAPGMWFERNGKVFVSMPGVPHEMKRMMTDIVIPKIKETFSTPVIIHRMVRTVGYPESYLAAKLAEWEAQLPEHIKLAYLPKLMQVRLRLTGFGENAEQLRQEIQQEMDKLPALIGDYIYGYDEESFEEAIGRMLRAQGKTLATAESCTGGQIAHWITSIPGSSDYFYGGMIPYQNDIKINVLGVKKETIVQHGAVSEETVTEMANRIRERFGTDYGLATSGVAGPGGGTPEKPVGMVWIAVADGKQTITKKLSLTKDRMINIQLSSVAVLDLLRKCLTEKKEINTENN